MLKQFTLDLLASSKLSSLFPGLGEDQKALLRQEALSLDQYKLTLHAPPPGWNTVDARVLLSYYNGDAGIIDAVKIFPMQDGGLLVGNYSNEWFYTTPDFNFNGKFEVGRYGDPQTYVNGYQRTYGGAMSPDERYVVMCCYYDHCIRCFDRQTRTVAWTFGDGTAGSPQDGRLYYPVDADFLPNGNVVVSCYSGKGDAAALNYGYVCEISSAGMFVRSHLVYTADNMGRANRDGVYSPGSLFVDHDDNEIFISCVGRDEVGRWDVSTTPWIYMDNYKKPSELDIAATNPLTIAPGPPGQILVYSDALKVIACLDRNTKKIQWATGLMGLDNHYSPANNPHEIYSVRGMMWHDGLGQVVASDYTNRRLQTLAPGNTLSITYDFDPPEGYDLEFHPRGFDILTKTLTIPVNELKNLSYSCREDRHGWLVLGWRKVCE
jgi:WD40 repeat protein